MSYTKRMINNDMQLQIALAVQKSAGFSDQFEFPNLRVPPTGCYDWQL